MTHLLSQFEIILKLFPFLWPSDWRNRLRFIIAIIFLFVIIGLNVGVPLFFRNIINILNLKATTTVLIELLLFAYGILWIISKLSEQIRLLLMARVIERGIRILCMRVFNHLINLSFRYHTSKESGAIISAIERAQTAFPNLVWGIFFVFFPTLAEIIIAGVLLSYLFGIYFGIILIIILTLYMIISVIGSSWSAKALGHANVLYAKANNKIVDSLMNYETIRYFGTQVYEHERCNKLFSEREFALAKQHASGELVHIGQNMIMGIGLIILTILSGIEVMKGALLIGDFVLINMYLLQFMTPLGQFGYMLRSVNEGLVNFKGILTILDEQPEVIEAKDAKPLIISNANIIFDNVKFAYDPRRPILKGISFEIPAKKTIAIVGPTGSGKSTIAKLLFRFYDVNDGSILIDKQDIRKVTLSSLHNEIGIVPQHTGLFNDTLYYNITYGSSNVSEENIKKTIELAQLDSFIKSLPDGLSTIVGEQGLKLSGGERQRIAIARVLLRHPKILLFDEATSSLDTKTEQIIQKNIEEVSRESTTIIIAHRLSTIVHADHIIVLDLGTIAEEGSHKELLNKEGLYSTLWSKQSTY